MEKDGRKDNEGTRNKVPAMLISLSRRFFFSLAINMAEATKQFKQSGDEVMTTEIILSRMHAIFIGYR
jgi:hypothetical protein